jgi:hypothetical protein
MKISELNKLSSAERSAVIPVSLNGETLGVTVGTVIDATDVSVVRFEGITNAAGNYTMHDSSPEMINERVVYDKALKNFYAAEGNDAEGWHYYTNWTNLKNFYSGDMIRKDCIFVADDGRAYIYDGSTLISAGVTNDQANAIAMNTPIEIASEEAMQMLIDNGEAVEGQLYYIVES